MKVLFKIAISFFGIVNRWPLARVEKALTLTLSASFVLPMLLGLLLKATHTRSTATLWLRNRSLNGMQEHPEPVPFSSSTLLSGRYQSAFANDYDTRYAGRELMIRLLNEVYLRALHASTNGILVGPNLSLAEPAYAEEYCFSRDGPDTFRTLVDDLRRLQDFCDAQGTAFTLVITPSKAAISPEGLPKSWLRRYQPGPRNYDLLIRLLQEKKIHYVDGHRIAADLKAAGGMPVFPLGSIHWGDPVALATTNTLLGFLQENGLKVQPIRDAEVHISWRPVGQDGDLAQLVNTAALLRYPVSVATVPPSKATAEARPNAVFVGGSFLFKMMSFLAASEQFSELDAYGYYKLDKSVGVGGTMRQIASPAPKPDFTHDIFAADAIVLELNEQTIHTQKHLTAFLHDALADLPDPRAAKAGFHFEGVIKYRWGDTLSFVEGDGKLINVEATKNFSAPTQGSFTEGPMASIEMEVQPTDRDVVLEASCGALTVQDRLPSQTADILANGVLVGTWTWTSQTPVWSRLVIPKELLGASVVKLEFRVAHPLSPAELGIGADQRQLGVLIRSLRMRLVGE